MSETYDPYVPRVLKQAARKQREQTRLSDSMADTVELSAEMAADGLISPEAHAETVAIAEAVVVKFGAKPVESTDNVAGAELRQFIERIERLEEECKTINDDKSSVYGEAAGRGYDRKILKIVVGMRRRDRDQVLEENTVLKLYLQALGMQDYIGE